MKRGIGQTTATARLAAELADRDEQVMIVAAHASQCQEIAKMADSMRTEKHGRILVISIQSSAVDARTASVRGFEGAVLFDHYAWEILYQKRCNELEHAMIDLRELKELRAYKKKN